MKKKVCSILLSITVGSVLIAGCGSTSSNSASSTAPTADASDAEATETSETNIETTEAATDEEPYEVRMLVPIPNETPSDAAMTKVTQAINDLTIPALNMTLDFEVVPFSTYTDQVNLALSSGEKLDILAAPSAYCPTWVNSGYLNDMTELLDQYGQDILSSYASEAVATSPQVNGFIYGVPVHKEDCMQTTWFARTDLIEKYNIDTSQIHSIADIDKIYETVAAGEPGIWVEAVERDGRIKTVQYDGLGGTVHAVIVDPANNTKVQSLYETDGFKEWCEYHHKWFENGWINSGSASDTESYYSYIKSGQAFSFFSDYGHPLSEADQEKNCGGVDLTMVTLNPPIASTQSAAVFCYTIPSGSENPEKAMQMLNFLMTNTDAMNILNWGIEGEDYVINSDGLADYPEGKDASSVDYHLGAGWILPNQFKCTPWVTDGADIYQKVQDYNGTALESKAMGFTFDPINVTDQMAAVKNVSDQYYNALSCGAVDPDEYIPKMIEETNDAGMQDIVSEIQTQLDAFLAQK